MGDYSKAIYHDQNQRYYKYKDSGVNKDILDAESENALSIGSSEYHDRFFKRNGVWYIQTKIANRYLFTEINPHSQGVKPVASGEYLDYLFDELKFYYLEKL
jgi:hypothetical protein